MDASIPPPTAQVQQQPQHRIRSSWVVRHAAGEPLAVVRVHNLQAAVQGPHDAWGRQGLLQPLLVSAELSFVSPFDLAVVDDNVTGGDTVHYGTLSKDILASIEVFKQQQQTKGSSSAADFTLRDLLETIWSGLTGLEVDGAVVKQEGAAKPLLDLSRLRFMSLTALLPKASLLGEGVSLTASSVFETGSDGSSKVAMYGLSLRLHKLRVPTLVGVNHNERLAKQFVVTDVELDKFDYVPDIYSSLEGLIVQTMEASMFETLEALGAHLSHKLIRDFRPQPGQHYSGDLGWQIKISMEKPTAVPFADCPVIQVRAGAGTK